MSKDAPFSTLRDLLSAAAARQPGRCAVEDEQNRTWTYAELMTAADRVASRLARWGIERGDRVGVFLPKSFAAVASIHGVLRAGAAYVPVDSAAPAIRGASILADAAVKAVVMAAPLVDEFRRVWPGPGPLPRLIVVEEREAERGTSPAGLPPEAAAWTDVAADDAPSPLPATLDPNDLAYILYTSGSTGKPKGVMLSHQNALTFIQWCRETLELDGAERFSSHAPFHFDLSVFDLFVCCAQSGTLVLIGESLGKDPVALGRFVSERRIDAWYSAPAILALLAEHGGLDRHEFSAEPRLVLFAGEVFPIRQLGALRALWPSARIWNLYGPTETNVCTAFPIPSKIAADRTEPYPIGRVCEPLIARVVDELGRDVPEGLQGELLISGPGVMRGYFGCPELTAAAFLLDEGGVRWYRTGDLVVDLGDGCFVFHGRRDRMVKKRGYRIELGEIESALYRHQDVDRAAVVARSDDAGVSITAFLELKPERKKSLIAMKRHCAINLPHYMVPDTIEFLAALPTTSTDKVDYQRLGQIVATVGAAAT